IVPGHLPHLCVMAWTPLLLLAVDAWRSAAPRGRGWVLLGMGAVAMQVLAGHPQYVYYTGLILSFYAILLASRAPRRWTFLAGFAAMYLGGAMLSAVQLLAGMQAVSESIRGGGTTYDFARAFFLPFENLLTFFAPRLFGDAVNTAYVGRWFPWETSVFVGVTTILLAGYATIAVPARRRVFAVTVAVVALLLALGRQTPLFELMYRAVPGFASFRGQSKFAHFASLFLALLAGMGFDELLAAMRTAGRPRGGRGLVLSAFAAAVLLAGLAIAVSPERSGLSGAWSRLLAGAEARGELGASSVFADPKAVAEHARHASTALLLASTTAAAFAIVLLVARRHWRVSYALPALLAAELLWFASAATPTCPVAPQGYDPAWRVALDRDPARADVRVLHRGMTYANLGMTLGYRDVWGYDPLVLRRYGELIGASQGEDPDAADPFMTFVRIPPVFRMLRMRYFFERHPNRPPVIAFDDPLPRFQLIGEARVVTDRDERLAALLAPEFDPRRTVLLERASPVTLTGAPLNGSIQQTGSSTDHFDFIAETDRPALLLITENYSSGWRIVSTGDAKPPQAEYAILPANHALMAVPLTPGRHHLRLEYSPLAFRIGAWVSGISLAGYLLAAWWLGVRCRRERQREFQESNDALPLPGTPGRGQGRGADGVAV
ncbi:MAG: YfhO family protein, partial [Planctomycetota bacterium]|nr:YfhO family protein [Planctomycetota bacterium]